MLLMEVAAAKEPVKKTVRPAPLSCAKTWLPMFSRYMCGAGETDREKQQKCTKSKENDAAKVKRLVKTVNL